MINSASWNHRTDSFSIIQWLQYFHSVSLWIHNTISINIITTTISASIPTSNPAKRFLPLTLLLFPNTHFLFSINPTVTPLNLPPFLLLHLLLLQQQQQQQQRQHHPRLSSKNRAGQVDFWAMKNMISSSSSKISDIFRNWNLGLYGFGLWGRMRWILQLGCWLSRFWSPCFCLRLMCLCLGSLWSSIWLRGGL